MFVTEGQRAQAPQPSQLKNQRNTRDQQMKEFSTHLNESNELRDQQAINKLALQLEEEAFIQSNGDNNRDYRSRVNTAKMKLKGLQGKTLRQALFDGTFTPAQMMAMDMNKINDDYLQAFLTKQDPVAAKTVTMTPKPTPGIPQIRQAVVMPNRPSAQRPITSPPIPQIQQSFVSKQQIVIPLSQHELALQRAQDAVMQMLPMVSKQQISIRSPHQFQVIQDRIIPEVDEDKNIAQQNNQDTNEEDIEFIPPQEQLIESSTQTQNNILSQMEKNMEDMKKLQQQIMTEEDDDVDVDDEDQDEDEEQDEEQYEEDEEQYEEDEDEEQEIQVEDEDEDKVIEQNFKQKAGVQFDNEENQNQDIEIELDQEFDQDKNGEEIFDSDQESELIQKQQEDENYEQDQVELNFIKKQDHYEQQYDQQIEQEYEYEEEEQNQIQEQNLSDQNQEDLLSYNEKYYYLKNKQIRSATTPLAENHIINREFIKEDDEYNERQQSQEQILDSEIQMQEQDYYNNEQSVQKQIMTEMQMNEQLIIDPLIKQQQSNNSQKQELNQHLAQLTPQFTFKNSGIQEDINQSTLDFFGKVQYVLVDKIVEQREQFYQIQIQKLEEKYKCQILEANSVIKSQASDLQSTITLNLKLQLENSLLQQENQLIKQETEQIIKYNQIQYSNLEKKYQQDKENWNIQIESILQTQQLEQFSSYYGELKQQQQEFSQLINQMNQKNRIQNENLLMQIQLKSSSNEQFDENLNEFRKLLLKLNPLSISQVNRRNQEQPQQSTTVPNQVVQEIQAIRSPPPFQNQQIAIDQRSQEYRQTQHENEVGFQAQQNIYADSGSTQTQKQSQDQISAIASPNRINALRHDDQVEEAKEVFFQQQVSQEAQIPQLEKKIQKTSQKVEANEQPQAQVFGHPKLLAKKKQDQQTNQIRQTFPAATQQKVVKQEQFQQGNQLQDSKSQHTDILQNQVQAPPPQRKLKQTQKTTERQEVPGILFD